MRSVFARLGAVCTQSVMGLGVFLLAGNAFAQEAAHEGAANPQKGLMLMALALGSSIATVGGALGQSRAATAALEGIARNPNAADKISTPLLLSLGLIESLVLLTWVLMLFLRGNL
jgi:F-type H+-transporting ATPase subunit c